MKTCPYCDRELVKDLSHGGVYYCRQFNNTEFDHRYVDDNGYLDFEMFKSRKIHVHFLNEKYISFNPTYEHAILTDFSILKNKSFEELQKLYNKLRIFK